MLTGGFEGAGDPQQLGSPDVGERVDGDERHLAGGDGAGLVEHDRVDLAGGFEHLGPLDEQPELSTAPGADEQCRGCGQAERARASDDQHGDGGAERALRVTGADPPDEEREQRQPDHDRHEHGRDPVGEALHGSLARLCVVDEAGDLGELRVGTDTLRTHDQPAVGVDGGTDHIVAGTDLDRKALAGDQRSIDGRAAVDHDAVGRHLLAGADDEAIADSELGDRQATLDPVVADHRHVLGTEVEQRPDRVAGAALGAGLEVATGEDEGDDRRRHLQVDVRRIVPVAGARHLHRHRAADVAG